MNKYVLDASALLALINQEAGQEAVANVITHSVMSAVNVSESIAILQKHNVAATTAQLFIDDMLAEIIPFNKEQALGAAILHKHTSKFGLSLGDRACLNLASQLNLPVLTADKVWSKVKIDIPIHIIR